MNKEQQKDHATREGGGMEAVREIASIYELPEDLAVGVGITGIAYLTALREHGLTTAQLHSVASRAAEIVEERQKPWQNGGHA